MSGDPIPGSMPDGRGPPFCCFADIPGTEGIVTASAAASARSSSGSILGAGAGSLVLCTGGRCANSARETMLLLVPCRAWPGTTAMAFLTWVEPLLAIVASDGKLIPEPAVVCCTVAGAVTASSIAESDGSRRFRSAPVGSCLWRMHACCAR